MQPPAGKPSDPADPKVWWRRLVDAVAGLQAKDKNAAIKYLQFVEEHRGRKVALQSKKQLIVLRDAPSWAGCNAWRNNGYQPTARSKR